jgi:hypothetical protein
MRVGDVTDTLERALVASGCDSAKVVHKPRLLGDNGSRYISAISPNGSRIAAWRMFVPRAAIRRPKARSSAGTRPSRTAFCLRTITCPAILNLRSRTSSITAITAAITKSLHNLTPADVYFGRGQTILLERERIKCDTIKQRRLQHHSKAAHIPTLKEPEPPFQYSSDCPKAFEDGHNGTNVIARRCNSPSRSMPIARARLTISFRQDASGRSQKVVQYPVSTSASNSACAVCWTKGPTPGCASEILTRSLVGTQ